jgi:uncharacterized protein (TIGR02466 family)
MKILDIFSTPIGVIRSACDIQETEYKIIESFDYGDKAHLNMFSKNYYVLNKLPEVKIQLEKHLKNYSQQVVGLSDNQELYITNSWCVKTPKGGYHPSHSHPNSLISGVLYLDVGENQNIVFEDESSIKKNFNFIYNNETNYNVNKFLFPVYKNDLILFPSSLKHEVHENKSDITRLILGFNTFIKGCFGNKNYPTELSIQ